MTVRQHLASEKDKQELAVIGDSFWRICVMLWLQQKFPDMNIVFEQALFHAISSAEVQVWISRKNGFALAGDTMHAKAQMFEIILAKKCLPKSNILSGLDYINTLLDTALNEMCQPLPPETHEIEADGEPLDNEPDEDDEGNPSCKLEALAWDLDVLEFDEGWTFKEHPDATDEGKRWEATKGSWHSYGKSQGSAKFRAVVFGYFG